MKRLARATIAAVTIIGLGIPGIVGATSSIDTTGPDSYNKVESSVENDTNLTNKNTVNAKSNTDQGAMSGEVKAYKNTTAGDATSGHADNEQEVNGSITVDNTGTDCGCASDGMSGMSLGGDITNTGPDSTNKIENKVVNTVEVKNTNTVNLTNKVSQHAMSGDVKVEKNTTGGNATSGNVSNTSTSSFEISVTN